MHLLNPFSNLKQIDVQRFSSIKDDSLILFYIHKYCYHMKINDYSSILHEHLVAVKTTNDKLLRDQGIII